MKNAEFNLFVGKRIKHYLNLYNMPQIELARKVGVSSATVSDWISGKKAPRMDKIDAMVGVFGCRRSDLMDESVQEEDSDTAFIINLMKSDSNAKQRLLAYARKLQELRNMEETPG